MADEPQRILRDLGVDQNELPKEAPKSELPDRTPCAVVKMTVQQSEYFKEPGHLPLGPPGARVSANLVQHALQLLCFYDKVDQHPQLRDPRVLRCALLRYERCWLPLLAKLDGRKRRMMGLGSSPGLQAPLDVAWVWLIHVLAPTTYAQDYAAVNHLPPIGIARPHCDNNSSIKHTQAQWKILFPDEPYFLDMDNPQTTVGPVDGPFSSNIKYNIPEAALNQWEFIYQVNLPHYRNKKFLQAALDRYLKFLKLKSHHWTLLLVPTFDMDLMWHAHMACCNKYMRDTWHLCDHYTTLLGRALYHDDAKEELKQQGQQFCDRFQETAQLWEAAYTTPMAQVGCMWRGLPPKWSPVTTAKTIQPEQPVAEKTTNVQTTTAWQFERPPQAVSHEMLQQTGKTLSISIVATNEKEALDSRLLKVIHCGPGSRSVSIRVDSGQDDWRASAYMIGCETLPLTTASFARRQHPSFTALQEFISRGYEAERGFMITNNGSDWGVLLCQWVAARPGEGKGTKSMPDSGSVLPRLFFKSQADGWGQAAASMSGEKLVYTVNTTDKSFRLDINLEKSTFSLTKFKQDECDDVGPAMALCTCIALAAMMLENGRGHRCRFYNEPKGMYGLSGMHPICIEKFQDLDYVPPWLTPTPKDPVSLAPCLTHVRPFKPFNSAPSPEDKQDRMAMESENTLDVKIATESKMAAESKTKRGASLSREGGFQHSFKRSALPELGHGGIDGDNIWMPEFWFWNKVYQGAAIKCRD